MTDFSEATYVQDDPVLKYPVGPGRFVIIFRYFSFWKYARLLSKKKIARDGYSDVGDF